MENIIQEIVDNWNKNPGVNNELIPRVEKQLKKSSRLFPLSYLFQKNQYKCDIVPSLPTGLCGVEPVEYAPI